MVQRRYTLVFYSAIAVALLADTDVLLLDEPLSSLDEPTRRDFLPLLLGVAGRYGLPLLHVTHALDEAQRIGERMIWLEGGAVRNSGRLATVVASPAFLRWRGSDAGVVVDGRVIAHASADHLLRVATPWGDLWVGAATGGPGSPPPVGSPVRLRVQARDVSLALQVDDRSSLLNQLPLTVVALADDGRRLPADLEADDVIQEAYARLSTVEIGK